MMPDNFQRSYPEHARILGLGDAGLSTKSVEGAARENATQMCGVNVWGSINWSHSLLRPTKDYMKIVIIICLILLMTVLGGLIYIIAPKYFEAQQVERDNSTKCKSYRALESIAAAMYREDPEGTEWLSKAREAETRRKQHKCSQLVLDK